MAGLPEGFAMLPEGQEAIYSGITIGNGAVANVMPSTADPQRPQLKARPPQEPQLAQSVPRPSTAANPASPPDTVPT
eukprot:4323848-Amphidinium_carterae.1